MVVHRLPSLLGDFEFDGLACLVLADCCPVHGVAVRRHVLGLQADDVAAAQLAVDRKIEQRQVASSAGDLKSRPDSPNVFWLERRLGSGELPFVPGRLLTTIAICEM